MILTCPRCATQFVVDDSALGAGGRRVRCSACQEAWLARPATQTETPTPRPPTEEVAPDATTATHDAEPDVGAAARVAVPMEPGPDPSTEDHGEEPDALFEPESEGLLFAPPPRPAPRRRTQPWRLILIVFAVAAALVVLFLVLRPTLENTVPGLRPAYQALGLADAPAATPRAAPSAGQSPAR